jgi:hypothetical protein
MFIAGAFAGVVLVGVETASFGVDTLTAARLAVYVAALLVGGLSLGVSPKLRPWLQLLAITPMFLLAQFLLFAWFYPLPFVPVVISGWAFIVGMQESYG